MGGGGAGGPPGGGRRRPKRGGAVDWALPAQFLGMCLVSLEAGSGAPQPVPPAMVKAVKAAISIPLIAGGGIRTPAQARSIARAGADIPVTGPVVERPKDPAALK